MIERVGIVGGSVAGLSLALELQRRGIAARVYERSAGLLAHQGAGLMLARPIVERLGLAGARSVRRRLSLGPAGQVLWRQAVEKHAVGWSEVIGALRAQVEGIGLYEQCSVSAVGADPPRVHTARFGTETFDLVVGADGIGSVVRAAVDPGFEACYLGCVAVRGPIARRQLTGALPAVHDSLLDDAMAKVLLGGAHVTLYGLPGGDEPLNWMWYLNLPSGDLPGLLTDAQGIAHRWSLPAGTLPAATEARLRAMADERLPDWLAALVDSTETLFLQPVYAGFAQQMVAPGLVLVGDAAHLAVPHVGGGVTLALQDTLALAEAVAQTGAGLEERLSRWEAARLRANTPRLEFAVRLGLSLQSKGKDWTGWGAADFERWWSHILEDAPDDASR